jgi:hypothetical protein
LLRIVGYVGGDNEVRLSHEAIGAIHRHAISSGGLQRLQHCAHTIVEELVPDTRPIFLLEDLELCDWNVAQEYRCP